MIGNKQVNLWRGPDPPPTFYHIWFKDERQLLRYNEDTESWEVFLDSGGIVKLIKDFMDRIEELSINGYSLLSSPVLNAQDILLEQDGHYIKKKNTLQQVALKLDSLLTTKVYE